MIHMLRAANIGDLDFIFNLIIDGAKEGHFNQELYTSDEAKRGFRIELMSILEKQVRLGGLRAYGSVYEIKGKRVGFLLISSGPGNKGNELWMASVDPEYRGKGHGKTMMLYVINQFSGKNLILFARCAPKSEVMYQLLTNNGFKLFETGPEGTRGITFQL